MSMTECEDWLEERILLDEEMSRKLDVTGMGGRPQRITALDRLADELGFNPDRLRCSGYEILDGLMCSLSAMMEARRRGSFIQPGSLIDDIDSGNLDKAVNRAVDGLMLDDAVAGMVQLGWGSRHISRRPEVRELEAAVQETLATSLKERVVRMLTKWYRGAIWTEPRRPHRVEHRSSAPLG